MASRSLASARASRNAAGGVVPRIGEGIRLLEPGGQWASYDVLDVWYQKAEYGDVWIPYMHVRQTPAEKDYGAVLRPDVDVYPVETR